MKVAIVEDEERAVNRLKQLLSDLDKSIQVEVEMETVREVIGYDWENSDIELIFLDIHLADGSSFEIFKHIQLDLPIIFTTAYDQYALEAFQVNSIDYLLKPVVTEKLGKAVDKWRNINKKTDPLSQLKVEELLKSLTQKKEFARNLLVVQKHKLIPVDVGQFAIFYIENSLVKGLTFDQQAYFPEHNMDELETILNPADFYRASRQVILNQKSIKGIESYFNSRLLVSTEPSISEDILVSKAKAKNFKNWLKGEEN